MIFLDEETCHRATAVRDPRFDGVFYLGVTSTGIYCRTVCRARRPKRENCRFFPHPASAELAGFRPCRLCRPEQAPGFTAAGEGAELAAAAVRRIEDGALDDGDSLPTLAEELGITPRHLRRVVRGHLGVSPVELAQTQRLLMAQRLLHTTRLPISEIALACGFRSLRRCNALFLERYGMPPTAFRRQSVSAAGVETPEQSLTVTLAYRPPFEWKALLEYFADHAIPGAEHITAESYARTLRIGGHTGWIRIMPEPGRDALRVQLAASLAPVLPTVLQAVRRTFDLDAAPSAINAVLEQDPLLAPSVASAPGLRLPGAADPFEGAVRTIIGQQVSVAAATTVMGRVVRVFGEPLSTPWPELNSLTLTAGRLAAQSVDTLAPLGLNSGRANALLALSRAVAEGKIHLRRSADPLRTMAQLEELPGIGPWTSHYIGMRMLGWPDAFLLGDLVVRKALAPRSPRQIEEYSRIWRPWRAYAVMHLWRTEMEKAKQSRGKARMKSDFESPT
ncbi:MAG: DNA-3-methyladenine glycosylase 2 family protein [Verrucomicrobiaceae bacterium]|nr:MAG: DNA-3-methyladenine glycosylase 2 family protein [Verrucomicrobiaceae bacterium]